MAEFKNWTDQIEVVGANNGFNDTIVFYNKKNTDGNTILGVKLDKSEVVLYSSNGGVEVSELQRFDHSKVLVPTSVNGVDLVEQIHTFIYNGDSIVGGAPIRDISITDTFLTSDYTINATTGTYTVNLPTAVGIKGKIYVIKNSGAGVITLDADGTETIDGALTLTVNADDSYTVQSDNSNWVII